MNGRRYWVTAAALLVAACGGQVQPLGEVAGGAGGSGGSTSGGSTSGGSTSGGGIAQGGNSGGGVGSGIYAACETPCFYDIVNANPIGCKVCHSATVKLDMGTLDMDSPGVSARLKDQPSAHKGIVYSDLTNSDPSGCPQGDKLIDSANPQNSWLLRKVLGLQGACGAQMPTGGMLSPAQKQCMQTFVNCVAAR